VLFEVGALVGGNIVINVGNQVIVIRTLLIHLFTSGLYMSRQIEWRIVAGGPRNSEPTKCFKFVAAKPFY
jgi:hypothetical protein